MWGDPAQGRAELPGKRGGGGGAPRGGTAQGSGRGGEKILRGVQRGAEDEVASVWGTVKGQECAVASVRRSRETEDQWDMHRAQQGAGGAVVHAWGAVGGQGCCEAHVVYSKGLKVQRDPYGAQQGAEDAVGHMLSTAMS